MTAINPIINFLIQTLPPKAEPILPIELSRFYEDQDADALCQNLNGAFLIILAGERHSQFSEAQSFLKKLTTSPEWGNFARFYLNGIKLITAELEKLCRQDPELKIKFRQVETALSKHSADGIAIVEKIWSVLFPEGAGIRDQEDEQTDALREKRIVTEIKATFKIDLDQVFPQTELIEQTGASAFEYFQTLLWGASGQDSKGKPIEMGMIAGALVNQRDIHKGLFTPDVTFPDRELQPDEYVFFSKLPQALSTCAEMMTRYQPGAIPDGHTTCLQRIHVTGGTNGILVDSLRRFQPFTPSFIGRAEDQAYLLSTISRPDRLGYVHAPGLIMRHDKEGFAQEAIAMAEVGKQISDYLRVLIFSAYAEALSQDVREIKNIIDPFTGCFISKLPITITLLRFALKVATLFNEGNPREAIEFIHIGIPQLQEGLDFTKGRPNSLQQAYQRERQGWHLFYDSLAAVEQGLQAGEAWALSLQTVARQIVSECLIN